VIIDVEVNQRTLSFVRHVFCRVKEMRMWSTIVADNNAESNGINDWSPLTSRELLLSCSNEDAEDGRGEMTPPD
jgi:hypothetical protein